MNTSSEGEAGDPRPSLAWRGERVDAVPARWEDRSDWISDDLCAVCHPDVVDAFADASHAALSTGYDGWGCEACHGPGGLHDTTEQPDDIDSFGSLDPAGTAEVCARCHFEDLRLLDVEGRHDGANLVACTSCHTVHPGHEPARKREAEDGCGTCHPEAVTAHLRSNHRDLMVGPNAPGCTACHTGGQAHARSLGARGTIALPDTPAMEALCQDCHGDDEGLTHFAASIHGRADLGCLDCHDLLQEGGKPTEAIERCGACHPGELAEFHLPFSHPLEDGTSGCTACHDPHSDRPSALTDARIRRRCEECHPRAAGPFVHEHEADRIDGCGACHQPHGSPSPGLLGTKPVRLLCLSCHPSTPANHSLASFSAFLDCVRCHTEIHGSDLDPKFFR